MLTGPTSVRVSGGASGDIEANATNVMLATGSAPRSLPGLDPDGHLIITSDEALRRNDVPKRVTIVGAGAIGVEWASMYRDFGAEVTLVEFAERVVPLEDPEISKELARVFKKRGISILTASTIDTETLKKSENEVSFQVAGKDGGKRTDVTADVILVAVGRRPLTENIGLEDISGLKVERGYVVVDEFMRTGVEHLYAIGDIVPGFALAHVASHEAVVAVEHMAGHDPEPVRMDLMPRVTFCRPQIASVGMSEAEATAAGHGVKTGSFPFRALGKATIVGEVDGFAKFVADADTGILLGAHIIGPHAGDLLAEPTLARLVEGTAAEIAMSVHAHPTLPRCSPRPHWPSTAPRSTCSGRTTSGQGDRNAAEARRARPERRRRQGDVPADAAGPRRRRAHVAHAARRQDRLHHLRPGSRGRPGGHRLADAPGTRLVGAVLPLDRLARSRSA